MQPCPEDYVRCYTSEEWDDLQFLLEENDIAYDMGPMGDVESAIHFTWELLFLSPWELAYISIPMTVIAFYVLTIYSAFKYIQRKFR
tara:strand:+ start:76 stop:336 length:261 start_codon:yes stop_codon:yes gene_type:complete